MILLRLLIGLGCLALGVAFLLDRTATRFIAILFITTGAVVLTGSAIAIHEANCASRFRSWLLANREEILANGASYEGQRIQRDTRLTQFLLVVSFIILTSRISTRLYVSSPLRPWRAAAFYSLLSGLAGWWSIVGIVYTPLAIFRNLTFRDTKSAAEVIENITQERLNAS